MIYFIADPHFGHEKIIRLCDRPFASAAEMDAEMLRRWNERVRDKDEVYILGDLFHRCDDPVSILTQLKGRKHLIMGNHDEQWFLSLKHRGCDPKQYFETVRSSYWELKMGGMLVVLSHYPIMSWHGMEKGSLHIFGHIHNDHDKPYWPLLCSMENALNAGVEVNDYRPVTIEELKENNRRFREMHSGMHNA